jgi:hypothetical protein
MPGKINSKYINLFFALNTSGFARTKIVTANTSKMLRARFMGSFRFVVTHKN